MKHFITKFLLTLVGVVCMSVTGYAYDFYLLGAANGFDSSDQFGWSLPGKKLTTDSDGNVYFWASGNFKISKNEANNYDGDGNFNDGAILIKSDGSVEYPNSSDSNLGTDKKYVILHCDGDGKYSVKISNSNNLMGWASIEKGGWTRKALDANNSYTFTHSDSSKESYISFITLDGSWDNAWRPSGGADVEIKENGEFTCVAGSNIEGAYYIKTPGTYTITVVDETNRKFKVEGFKKEDAGLKGWAKVDDVSWQSYELDENKSFTITTTDSSKKSYISFGTGDSWPATNYWAPNDGDTPITANGQYQCYTDRKGQYYIKNAGTYKITVVDEANHIFKVEGFGGNEQTDPTVPDNLWARIWLHGGQSENWTNEMDKDGNKFTTTIENYTGQHIWFRFCPKNTDDKYTLSYGRKDAEPATSDYLYPSGSTSTTLTLHSDAEADRNISYEGNSCKSLIFTVDFSDANNPTVTITEKNNDTPETYPEKLYMYCYDERDAKPEATGVDGVYSWTIQGYPATLGERNLWFHFTDEGKSLTYYRTDAKQMDFGTLDLVKKVGYEMKSVLFYNASYTGDLKVVLDITGETPTVTISRLNEVKTLYIGGNYSGGGAFSSYKKLTYDKTTGGFAPYTITAKAGDLFRFSTTTAHSNSNSIGASSDHASVKVGDNNASKSTNVFKFDKSGEYTITVTSYDVATGAVAFTVAYTAPDVNEIRICGDWFTTDRSFDNGETIKVGEVYDVPANSSDKFFGFYSVEHRFGPASGNEDVSTSTSQQFTAITITDKYSYKIKDNSLYSIRIDKIEDGTITWTLLRRHAPYYFVGDMNEWFSTYFDDASAVGGNMDLFPENNKNWKFEYVESGDYAGWYKFDFKKINSKGRFSGQFQILGECNSTATSGLDWSNFPERYFHGNGCGYNDDEYFMNYYTTSYNIDGSEEWTTNVRRPSDISTTAIIGGQNFHINCNAVDNCVIYFKPGKQSVSSMKIIGTPVNFYVFYAQKKTETDHNVKAKLRTGKPNDNNYYLPGISGGKENFKLPHYDENGNKTTTNHMNLSGVDLTKFSIEEFSGLTVTENANKVKAVITDNATYSYLEKGRLPNGVMIDKNNWKNVYVAKIPNGFENPAGTSGKYELNLLEAVREDDTKDHVTIANNHVYFLPDEDGVHVHAAIDGEYEAGGVKMSDYDWEISYRVYYQDNFAMKVQKFKTDGTLDGDAKTLYARGERVTDTFDEDETSETRNFGWHPLDEKKPASHWSNESEWSNMGMAQSLEDFEWNFHHNGEVANENGEYIGADGNKKDPRVALPEATMKKGYIQFQMIGTKKTGSANGRERAASDGPDVIYSYAPSKLTTVSNTENVYPLSGGDVYMYVSSNSDTWTGVEEIIIENPVVDSDEAATPVYYNLQGLRVENPTKGIYIKVTGSKSEKVMF